MLHLERGEDLARLLDLRREEVVWGKHEREAPRSESVGDARRMEAPTRPVVETEGGQVSSARAESCRRGSLTKSEGAAGEREAVKVWNGTGHAVLPVDAENGHA